MRNLALRSICFQFPLFRKAHDVSTHSLLSRQGIFSAVCVLYLVSLMWAFYGFWPHLTSVCAIVLRLSEWFSLFISVCTGRKDAIIAILLSCRARDVDFSLILKAAHQLLCKVWFMPLCESVSICCLRRMSIVAILIFGACYTLAWLYSNLSMRVECSCPDSFWHSEKFVYWSAIVDAVCSSLSFPIVHAKVLRSGSST